MTGFNERLNGVIPGGAHTYSRGFDQYPANAPQILERGEGAYVWDAEGRRLLDYGMALRAVTLGYANRRVNDAAFAQMERGNNLTRPSLIELEAAELLVDLIPGVDMVKFAKNGSNVTTAAVKLARAFTDRRYVCVPRQQPFFSFDDWFISTTPMNRGIPESGFADTLMFDYGDIGSLEDLFASHPGEIAAVLMEPATTLTPCGPDCERPLTFDSPCRERQECGHNFLTQVQSVCRSDGAVFIMDEMISGFRWDVRGAAHFFGVEPDLRTYGKGMANGYSVAAVAGIREIMELGGIDQAGAERTFLLSTTHGGEMGSLGAFVETMAVYEDEQVVRHLWDYGRQLRVGLSEVADAQGVSDVFTVDGPDICLNYVLRGQDGSVSMELRTLFAREMIKHGVMMPWIAISLAHGDKELQLTLSAAEEALKVVREALDDPAAFLDGPAVKPVFRKYN